MFLFDTDVLSNVVRGSPPRPLQRRLDEVPQALHYTSTITVGELLYGAFRMDDGGRRERIIESLLPSVTVLPFDIECARVYGRLRAELEKRGTPIGESDTRIAAVALVHNLILVTGNTRHFDRVPGLRIENWLA